VRSLVVCTIAATTASTTGRFAGGSSNWWLLELAV
jgi:hypothetical protein